MRNSSLLSGFASAVVLSALLAACGGDDAASPTSPPGRAGNPHPVRVEIVGPRSVAPGAAVQFSMLLHMSDGTRRDVSTETNWQSRAPQVLSVGSTGVVTGLQTGEGDVYGFYRPEGALNANKEVIVVPAGTYRLMGVVSEVGAPTAPIIGARVDIVSPAGNASSITGNDGRYRFYGVSGNSEVRVSKNGYEIETATVTVADHGVQNFELRLSHPRSDISGTFTLTLTAADTCRGVLPDQALQRVYTATIAQRGAELETKLSGATFVTNRTGKGNSFSGLIEPTQLRFTLNLKPWYNYYPYVPAYYPDLVEQLDSAYLVVSGSVLAQGSGSRISGPLNGSIAIWSKNPQINQSPTANCTSTAHQFVLTR
jgi:hypothetical protein